MNVCRHRWWFISCFIEDERNTLQNDEPAKRWSKLLQCKLFNALKLNRTKNVRTLPKTALLLCGEKKNIFLLLAEIDYSECHMIEPNRWIEIDNMSIGMTRNRSVNIILKFIRMKQTTPLDTPNARNCWLIVWNVSQCSHSQSIQPQNLHIASYMSVLAPWQQTW